MAAKFDIEKFNVVKAAYIAYLKGIAFDSRNMQAFSTYMGYLDADADVKKARTKAQEEKRKKELEIKVIRQKYKTEKSKKEKKPKVSKKTIAAQSQPHKNEYELSPRAQRIQQKRLNAGWMQSISDIEDEKSIQEFINSAVFTALKVSELKYLRSRVVYLCEDEINSAPLVEKINTRIEAIENQVKPTATGYIPKPIIIYTPIGGQNGKTRH